MHKFDGQFLWPLWLASIESILFECVAFHSTCSFSRGCVNSPWCNNFFACNLITINECNLCKIIHCFFSLCRYACPSQIFIVNTVAHRCTSHSIAFQRAHFLPVPHASDKCSRAALHWFGARTIPSLSHKVSSQQWKKMFGQNVTTQERVYHLCRCACIAYAQLSTTYDTRSPSTRANLHISCA